MFKKVLFLACALVLVLSQTACPSTLLNKCEAEVQKGMI